MKRFINLSTRVKLIVPRRVDAGPKIVFESTRDFPQESKEFDEMVGRFRV